MIALTAATATDGRDATNNVGDQQHAGFAHQRDGQAEQAFEQPGTGNEKRRGCAARPGVGEQDEPERARHRYIGPMTTSFG